jgi:YfiH family protein
MISLSIFSDNPALTQAENGYIRISFGRLFNGVKQSGADCFACITTRKTGAMRFRRNEENPRRDAFFAALGVDFRKDNAREFRAVRGLRAVPLELIHSQTVFVVENADEDIGARGDGIITSNSALVPVITVADCMPIFLFNPAAACFGVLHSGWKGTGIVREALTLAQKTYGAAAKDFFAVMGPHIQQCCYTVEKERADYFAHTFTPECVTQKEDGAYHLSLAEANRHILVEAGVPENHIALCTDCTSCDTRLGSFRREAAELDMPLEEKMKRFTAMAAFAMRE